MSSLALEARGLSKAFGALNVTRDVSLALAPGARQALIGPNGAGKSTLVGLLSGVLRPNAGTVALFGEDVTRAGAAHRTRAGLVRTFQISSLFARLSVLENVFLAVSEHARRSFEFWRPAGRQRELIERSEHIVAGLGLGDDLHRRVSEIAYGRQRLVEIAIALALQPKVLLLDEPAAGIPSGELGLLKRAIDGLPADIAILMIEHDMEMVRNFATEITVLVEGRVLMTGDPATVMSSPEVQSVYLGSAAHGALHA